MNIQPTSSATAVAPQSPGASRPDGISQSLAKAESRQASAASTTTSLNAVRNPQEVEKQTLEDAMKKVEQFVSPMSSSLKFELDEQSGMRVVKVVDNETKDVIRQIPSEEMLAIARALESLQGLLVKQTA